MKRSKFSEEQIVYAIRQAESGTPVGHVCRQLGLPSKPSTPGKEVRASRRPTQTAGGRPLASKGPQAISKINVLRRESFQHETWFYNGLQIGCPI